MRLVSNAEAIEQRFHFKPVEQLLFTTIRRDSHRVVSPIMARLADRDVLLVRQQELGNVLTAGVQQADIVVYEPYVTFEKNLLEVDAASSLVEAVSRLAGEGVVTVDDDFPFHHFSQLEGAVELTVDPPQFYPGEILVYELSEQEILAKFRRWREWGAKVVSPILLRTDHLKDLVDEFTTAVDSRYEALGELAATAELDAILVSAPPNFSEFTGVAGVGQGHALWVRGSDCIRILVRSDRYDAPGTPVARYGDLGEAVSALVSGETIGVENHWITVGDAQSLGRAGLTPVGLTRELGTWRDLRDREDLPFQVLAARASLYCIETALQFAHEELDARRELTEGDVYRRYLQLIHDYRFENGIPFTIEPYMVNSHASNRVLYPCLPSEFPLDSDLKCMMFDAGVKISIEGVVLGTSDMGRTLVRDPAVEKAYQLLKSIIHEEMIANIRPGVSMETIHEHAMEGVRRRRSEFEELGVIDPGVDFETPYRRRNVGHLMGKQESFSNEFRPGDTHRLEVGDIGAAEMPWIYGDVAMTYEDMWFIGKDRVFVTSW